MIAKYIIPHRIKEIATIFLVLIISIIHPKMALAVTAGLLSFRLAFYAAGGKIALFWMALSIVSVLVWMEDESITSLLQSLPLAKSDDLSLAYVFIACCSAPLSAFQRGYKVLATGLLLLLITITALKTEDFIQNAQENRNAHIKQNIEQLLKKMDDKKLEECLTQGSISGFDCMIFQKRYPLQSDDENLNSILSAVKDREHGYFTWTQKVDLNMGLLKDRNFSDTDHDVLDATIGILSNNNSVVILAAPNINSDSIRSDNYVSMFWLSISALLLYVLLITIQIPSQILYYSILLSIPVVSMPGNIVSVALIFVILSLTLSRMYIIMSGDSPH